MAPLRAKSDRLTGLMTELLGAHLSDRVEILTPSEPAARGCQLSLRIVDAGDQGRRVFKQLQAQGVVADWREPDVIRVAPVPLYNRFEDVVDFVRVLEAAL